MSETRVVHVKDNVPGAVYIGRSSPRSRLTSSPLANPYHITKAQTRTEVIANYRWYLDFNPVLLRHLPELRGKPLACWCRHDGEERTEKNACHGDVIVDLLNRYTDEELLSLAEKGLS